MFEAQLRPDPEPESTQKRRNKILRLFGFVIQLTVLLPLQVLALPLILIGGFLSPFLQQLRFPYDRKLIRKRLEETASNPRDAKLYLQGLIDGYYRPRTSWPSADPRQRAFHDGVEDGTALRQNRLTIENLPTRTQPYPDLSEFGTTDSEFVSLGSCFENSMAATSGTTSTNSSPSKRPEKSKHTREKANV